VIVAAKQFRFQSDWGLIIKLVSFTGVIFIFGWFFSTYIQNWFAGALILTGVSVLCAFVIRLLNIKDLYRIVRFGE
jgi:hypothetical protein